MTTWHCEKCSLRFGTYADFGDHWRTDHRNDPITERAAERAKAWDAGFTERGNQEQMQRRDRFHAIERENPYSEVQ